MSTSHEDLARQLMTDPIEFFEQSITKMHTIARDELESLQRTAMSMRFKEHYESIEILRNLADRQSSPCVPGWQAAPPSDISSFHNRRRWLCLWHQKTGYS
jgi:hypothetical protein